MEPKHNLLLEISYKIFNRNCVECRRWRIFMHIVNICCALPVWQYRNQRARTGRAIHFDGITYITTCNRIMCLRGCSSCTETAFCFPTSCGWWWWWQIPLCIVFHSALQWLKHSITVSCSLFFSLCLSAFRTPRFFLVSHYV